MVTVISGTKLMRLAGGAACLALSGAVVASRPAAQSQQSVPPRTITQSMTVPAGTYAVTSDDLDHPAITIHGSDITVDFRGVVLGGAAKDADPDTFTGLAVLVDGGENVTIRNLTARGYKVGLVARGTRHLHVTGSNLSYNWKARLYSLVEHESLVDWLSYHHNEKDEWLQGGAGIYLSDTEAAEIDGTTVTHGQNGLMLVRSNGARIWNNDLSFLSGIGIGLYRASGNTIMHNRVDWCVRGYSHGFYNRGQDSAGILIYEQSSKNTVAFNSVTHGGDGFFLWAGQTTMDTGEGGANDNVVYDNDFSFAPTNGIEATFSRNTFVNNRVEGNWHGVWGGYSYESHFIGNRFARNVEGMAIEHGQDNEISNNTFDGDETAIRLWQNASQDPDWGYPRHHDTRSRDYDISHNHFVGNTVGLKVTATDNVRLRENSFAGVVKPLDVADDAKNVGEEAEIRRIPFDFIAPKPLAGGMDAKIPEGERRGREAIIVDDWGPYDWASPKLWPDGRSDVNPLKLRVLGPAGKWRIASVRDATVEPREGTVPGEIVVTAAGGAVVDLDVQLTYTGARVVSPRGDVTPAGAPYRFGYTRYFVPIDWTVTYFAYGKEVTPASTPEFAQIVAGPPLKKEHRDRLDFMSGRAIAEGVPADRVALIAEGDVDLPTGRYDIRTISDDAVRVWVDDERVIDHWTPHESAIDRAPLAAGKHRIKVWYYEVEGFAELRFEILRR